MSSFFTQRNLTIAMFIGIGLGVALGFGAQWAQIPALFRIIDSISFLGELFLALLQMVVVPLVLFSVTTGVANLHGGREVGRKLGKTVAYFFGTSFVAVLIGIFVTNLAGPGRGLDPEVLYAQLPEDVVEAAQARQDQVALAAPQTLNEFLEVQINNLFMNPFRSLAEMNLVGVVMFSLLLGFMIMLLGEAGKPARDLFNALNKVMMKMVSIVIWFAPVGIFALSANLLSSIGPDIIAPLLKYVLTVAFGLGIQFLVVFPLIIFFICRYNPLRFVYRVKDALLLALASASSAATLPVTLRAVEEEVGVDKDSANLVVPMGATVNMNGTALYEAVAAIFVAQLIGIPMDLGTQFILFFTATLAAIGTAGIPQGGLVTMVIVFTALGIPLEFIALLIVVDRPVDHLRTMVNVCGDAVGSLFLSTSEKKFIAK